MVWIVVGALGAWTVVSLGVATVIGRALARA